jgi:DNA-binding MarR family transcriptional regulator
VSGDGVEQLTGLLLVRAAKLHRGVVARQLSEIGLHVGQDLLLLALEHSDGLSQRELADRLDVEQATVAVALRRLETAGFIRRSPAPDDRRVRRVVLTEQGMAALAHVRQAWTLAEAALTRHLNATQAAHLHQLLNAVTARAATAR